MKKIYIPLIIICLSTSISFAQQNDIEYKKAIQKMFMVSGGDKTYKAVMTQMLGMIKRQNANVPNEYWNKMSTKFSQSAMTDLIDRVVPIYKKHLSLSEINQLISFYQSPIGKKFAEKTPLITQESMVAGQQWGMQLAKEITEEIKKKNR